MCGFAGYLGGWPVERGKETLTRMADRLVHRGPDDAGYWHCPRQGIGMAHRRLSVVDLSAAGHQPMHAAGSRYAIVFNGEIYNHMALRAMLDRAGHAGVWRGHSDTETLLAGFERWGVQATVEKAIGMFAFAVWDKERETLTLGRDRLGEKPLYYGWQGTGQRATFLFASELKALRAHPAFSARIDRGALCLQLRHNYIPAPYSIYEGIRKVMPGHLLTVSMARREPVEARYWCVAGAAGAGVSNPFGGSPEQAVDELDALLRDAVGQQLMGDVPVGAFLSGGIDSSLIVSLMQMQSSRPVRTFSIGFHESDYNEAQHAMAVARHLKTDHQELYVTPAQAMAVIPALPALYDEPFSDSSQIPTFLLSQLARQHVTVSLSGDGGDELFCGYGRYLHADRLWRRIHAVPAPLRRLAVTMFNAAPANSWEYMETAMRAMPGRRHGFASLQNKAAKGLAMLAADSVQTMYSTMLAHWHDPAAVVVGGTPPASLLTGVMQEAGSLEPVEAMMLLDMQTYLCDDVLVKVDRAAMGASLETRAPFLDHRVLEFAWRLPRSMKLRGGQGKWLLRELLSRYVPTSLTERPKMGFGVPVGAWLRGPLRDWAEALLDPARLHSEGFLQAQPIRRRWQEHLSGSHNWQSHLWDVLMFQAWLEHQRGDGATAVEQAWPEKVVA